MKILLAFFKKKIQKIENIELGKFIKNFTYIYIFQLKVISLSELVEFFNLMKVGVCFCADNPIQGTKQYQLLLYRKWK